MLKKQQIILNIKCMHHIIIIYSMKNGLSFWDFFVRKHLAVLLNYYCFFNINSDY